MELEKIALEDPYFVERSSTRTSTYSGIVQKAIGIPTEMFTRIFALARTVGWMTQWEEMITDPEYKIGRPRQLYTGAAKRTMAARPTRLKNPAAVAALFTCGDLRRRKNSCNGNTLRGCLR